MGGFAAGVALVILGGGFALTGAIALLISLPPLDWPWRALAALPDRMQILQARVLAAHAALVGLAAAAPLGSLTGRDNIFLDGKRSCIGMSAAGVSLLLAWGVESCCGRCETESRSASTWMLAGGGCGMLAALLPVRFGPPAGFYGDSCL